jgi:hypothetical protein
MPRVGRETIWDKDRDKQQDSRALRDAQKGGPPPLVGSYPTKGAKNSEGQGRILGQTRNRRGREEQREGHRQTGGGTEIKADRNRDRSTSNGGSGCI